MDHIVIDDRLRDIIESRHSDSIQKIEGLERKYKALLDHQEAKHKAAIDSLKFQISAATPPATPTSVPTAIGIPPLSSINNLELTYFHNTAPGKGNGEHVIKAEINLSAKQFKKQRDHNIYVTLYSPTTYKKKKYLMNRSISSEYRETLRDILRICDELETSGNSFMLGMVASKGGRSGFKGQHWHDNQFILVRFDGAGVPWTVWLSVADERLLLENWQTTDVAGKPFAISNIKAKSYSQPCLLMTVGEWQS